MNLFIRFKSGSDQTGILQALSTNPGLLEALDEKKWKKSIEQSFVIGADYLQFNWKYTFRMHSAEKLAAVHTAIVEAIRSVAPPPELKCELCKSTSVGKPQLYNGIPGYYCGSCQSQAQHEQNAAGEAYEKLETNLPRGLLFGILAAIVGAIAWGGVAYAIHYIFFSGALLIGALVAKAVFYGIGKINLPGQIAVFVLTVASVFFGDAIFFTLSVMKSEAIPFSAELLVNILKNMVEIETKGGNGVFTALFAVAGAASVVWSNRKPKFVAVFEDLETLNVPKTEAAFAGK